MPEDLIEEAQLVDETTSTTQVLTVFTEADKPALPAILNKDEAIKLINEEFDKHNVEIENTKDTTNYKKVVAGLKSIRDSRLAWDKSIEQNVYGPAKEWFAKLGKDYDAILAEFKAKELLLKNKKEAIDLKKKEEKEEAERQKTLVLGKRIETIVGLGGKSDGSKYTFPYDLTLDVAISTIKDLDDKAWEETLAEIEVAFNKESDRMIAEKKVAEDLAKANLSEAKKLNEKRTALRRKELKIEGFTCAGEGMDYMNDSMYVITEDQILNLEDEEWDLEILKSSDKYVPEKKPAVSSGGGIAFGGGKVAPVEIPKSTPAPVVAEEDDDVSFPWADNEETQTVETPVVEEPKVSEELGIKQRVLNFSKVNPFIDFEVGNGFVMRIFPSEDKDSIYSTLGENSMASEGAVNETLSFILIFK